VYTPYLQYSFPVYFNHGRVMYIRTERVRLEDLREQYLKSILPSFVCSLSPYKVRMLFVASIVADVGIVGSVPKSQTPSVSFTTCVPHVRVDLTQVVSIT
jgi:hypothetical protein